MLRPSSPACTTAAPPGPPAAQPPSPAPATKRRGNPNLTLIPRCGARTRAGCPCRAPAIHGKLRCRMHGGRSTGPRTADGMARLRAVRTIHGDYSADSRAFNRHHVSFLRRSRVRTFAVLHRDRLPPELAARMNPIAPELRVPPRPTCGITRAEDRVLLLAETAALAPWKQAMALARQARRADAAIRATSPGAGAAAQVGPLAPEQAVGGAAPGSAASLSASAAARPGAHAPIPPAPARPAWQPAPASARAEPLAKPDAAERAAHGLRSARPPAHPAALPEGHAPIPQAAAQPGSQPAPAGGRAEPAAQCQAPNPASDGVRGAVAPAGLAAQAKAHAPILPTSAQPAPASARAEPATKPHAPNPASDGVRGAVAPAGLAAQAKAHAPILPTPAQPAPASARAEPAARPHAPIRAPNTDRVGRTIPVGRAARRWLRQQKRMHQHQPGGSRP